MASSSSTSIFFLLLLLTITLTATIVLVHSDPSDESCLSALYTSFSHSPSLHNWTTLNFANPCNGFTSFISGATCNNGRIFKLSLPNLSLSGTLPSISLSNCTNLQTLDLSSNLISGPIPLSISSLLNLAVLNLSRNLLSGHIPPQLALCAYLNVIDLHSNRLTGPIPDSLGLLVRLSAFDVSFNDLQGPIPVTLANRTSTNGGARFNASSFIGNRDLYGFPLPPMRRQGLSVMAIVGIGLGSGLMSLVISFTAVCLWLRVTERSAMVNGEMMMQQQQNHHHHHHHHHQDGKISSNHLSMPDY